MYAGFYPDPRPVDEVIGLVGLASKRNSAGDQALRGQQRRLDVAIALAGDPELLFLDEPTTGFDPSARHEAWEVIKNLADARQDGAAHHALHGRGAVPGRPGRGDRGRADRGRGRPGHASAAGTGADDRGSGTARPTATSLPPDLRPGPVAGRVQPSSARRRDPRRCTSSPDGRSTTTVQPGRARGRAGHRWRTSTCQLTAMQRSRPGRTGARHERGGDLTALARCAT